MPVPITMWPMPRQLPPRPQTGVGIPMVAGNEPRDAAGSKVARIPVNALILREFRHRGMVDGNRLVSGLLLLVRLHQIQTHALQTA